MDYKLLITGFDAFADNSVNPSFQVAQTLAFRNDIPGVSINAYEMPTKWDVSAQILTQILARNQYDGLIMIGLAANRAIISLEKTAQNLDDSTVSDNAGILRQNQIIDPAAPEFLHTNLPVEPLASDLTAEGFPVEVSHSAGNYICNHLYFQALNLLSRPKDIVFIHIPPTDEMKINNPEYPASLPFNQILNFLATLIMKLANQNKP